MKGFSSLFLLAVIMVFSGYFIPAGEYTFDDAGGFGFRNKKPAGWRRWSYCQ
jgi:hypothetical protein